MELKGSANQEVSADMVYLVEQWLTVAQGCESRLKPWDFYDDDIPF